MPTKTKSRFPGPPRGGQNKGCGVYDKEAYEKAAGFAGFKRPTARATLYLDS